MVRIVRGTKVQPPIQVVIIVVPYSELLDNDSYVYTCSYNCDFLYQCDAHNQL